VICPFCLVGYSRVRQAIKELRSEGVDAVFKLRFLPFQLDPTLPFSPGENKFERYERRFGGKDKVAAMVEGMKERGRQLEPPVEFSYGGNVSNTIDAHRLIEKAYEVGGEETQLKLVERCVFSHPFSLFLLFVTFLPFLSSFLSRRLPPSLSPLCRRLFNLYFEREADIGSFDILSDAAVETSVFAEKDKAVTFLKSDEKKKEVEIGFEDARQKGISGAFASSSLSLPTSSFGSDSSLDL
jgi:predicted DsbA family dithiol-disulfide isomerase